MLLDMRGNICSEPNSEFFCTDLKNYIAGEMIKLDCNGLDEESSILGYIPRSELI
ncbi:hypothetical protein [Photobacterium satsumensis]|uniref:hypothetical protein n=1 Tax=Photobacterium satsumensis TaxID=2910239 RepID=UPI003D09A282